MIDISSKSYRKWAVWLWSFGFAIAAADRLSVALGSLQISYSYFFFTLAFILCLLAEKKEFSLRVALYRIHDVAIYGPWRFLLLYLLWTAIFAPFTNDRVTSIIFNLGGWFSLLAVGFSAELILCERSIRGSVFVPERLRIPFLLYSLAMILLFFLFGLRLFFPNSGLPNLNQDPVNLLLYFSFGFPFLLWDFLKAHRRLIARRYSGLAIIFGMAVLILIGRRFFYLSAIFFLASLASLTLYKERGRLRFFLPLLSLSALCFAFVAVFYLYMSKNTTSLLAHEFLRARELVELRLLTTITNTWDALWHTRFLGLGLGLSPLQRGLWSRLLVESGVVGFVLYGCYFADLLLGLYRVRHAPRVIVSNVAFLSALYFIFIGNRYLLNPYGAYIWAWYAIWTVFSAYYRKKEV